MNADKTAIPLESIEVSAYTIPTDSPEADGTYRWEHTTLVLVEVQAGGKQGLGYTYADLATAKLIETLLAPLVKGRNALDVPGAWLVMSDAFMIPFSAHRAPSLHVHACCAVMHFRHMEYFHDHVRIEHMLFDGALTPQHGALAPDLSRPGLGLTFKHADAQKYAV